MKGTEIFKKQWSYVLSKEKRGQYWLGVVCGSVGLFEVEYQLSQTEFDQYLSDGEAYIEQLAYQIRRDPGSFSKNKIE